MLSLKKKEETSKVSLFRPIVAISFKESLKNWKMELFTCCKVFVWKKDPRKEGHCAY